MLKLGNQGVAAMYLGGRKITKAYLGEALVFGASAPPEPVRYTVTLSVDPQGGGTASGGGSVEAGAQVTVTASASSGYTFSGWRENGIIVSTSASYTFTVTGDRSLTAVFAAVIPTYRGDRPRGIRNGQRRRDLPAGRQRDRDGRAGRGVQVRQVDGERPDRQRERELYLYRHRGQDAHGRV